MTESLSINKSVTLSTAFYLAICNLFLKCSINYLEIFLVKMFVKISTFKICMFYEYMRVCGTCVLLTSRDKSCFLFFWQMT